METRIIEYFEYEDKLVKNDLTSFTNDTEIHGRSWLNVINPTQEILQQLSFKTGINLDFLLTTLDEEETARIDREDGDTLIVLDVPCT
ncbi:MAG: hypothetical protein IAC58_04075, partial [Firmicutes bacterium]|nr:hypothetical protein [Candidatus Onthovivens merdipullorum]